MRTSISNLGRQMLPLGNCPGIVTCFDAGMFPYLYKKTKKQKNVIFKRNILLQQ
jgi:hypothetical protein